MNDATVNKKSQQLFSYLQECQQRINNKLVTRLPSIDTKPKQLHKAMHYTIFNGGKRIRPALVYATGQCFDANLDVLDIPAIAIELIHCYSLVHDDLPAMDDDDLRRGQPTCHRAFDEAIAILVGDALQSLAFEILAAQTHLKPKMQIQMIKTLAQASGSLGMAGGQALDLEAEGKKINLKELENIHRLKTGALIRASIYLSALASGCSDPTIQQKLDQFAQLLGLAFQIRDDILNVEGSSILLGKQTGTDISHGKASYPTIMNLETAKHSLSDIHVKAQEILYSLDMDTSRLQQINDYVMHREK